MAPSVSLGLCVLLVFAHSCFAYNGFQPFVSSGFGPGSVWQGQQRHRPLRSQNECNLDNINALEPTIRIRSQAGESEYWNGNDQQFQCAGVNAVRHVIEPKGLLLPVYSNSPQLSYIVEGRGVMGAVFPGCPETYQSGSSSRSHSSRWSRESEREQSRGQFKTGRSSDQHQKIRNFRQGDIIALPAGVAHWIYNNGQTPIVAVTVYDTSNDANQLDQNIRKFFLAGSSQQGQGRQGGKGYQGKSRQWKGQSEQGQNWQNLFSGLDEELLSDAFNVDQDVIRNLRGENDNRGSIVRVEKELQFLTPEREEEEQRGEWRQHGKWNEANGLEETFCNARLIQNIGDPIQADVFNPNGGRVTNLNSQKLPILSYLQLSAERGVLYKNALLAPKYDMFAHRVIYVTRGSGRIQMVNEQGKNVFDGELQEGQLLIVPQNFVVLKQAQNEGFEWVVFKTSDNSLTNPLAGRVSVFRGLPEEVLMNSYGISREEAKSLKFNREEFLVFGSQSSRQRMEVEA